MYQMESVECEVILYLWAEGDFTIGLSLNILHFNKFLNCAKG